MHYGWRRRVPIGEGHGGRKIFMRRYFDECLSQQMLVRIRHTKLQETVVHSLGRSTAARVGKRRPQV